jgi:hypothetical protein
MENENIPSMDWPNVLLQWALFFALLAVILIPAFKFRNLAKEYNKRGWVYFIIGLGVGIIGFYLGQVVVVPLRYYVVIPQEYVAYLILLLFLSAYLSYRFSYKFLKNYFTKSQ